MPAGRAARGVPVVEAFRTVVANVAEVTVRGRALTVDRVVSAVDCGIAVNPDNVRAQMEGGAGFGLSAALHGRIGLAAMTTAAATAPAATVSPWAIAALSFAAFASAASMRVTDALLPRLGAEFGVGLGAAAQVVTAFSVAYGLLQAPYGLAGDHFGKYRLVAAACFASAVAALGCALAPRFGVLVAARFVAGGTAAAIIPLSMAWIGDVVAYDRRQPVLARFLIGQIFGLASGQFIGGVAADYWSWHAPFVALAAWFAVAGLVLLRMRARVADPGVSHAHGNDAAGHRLLAGFAYVLRRPWARVVLITVFLEGAALFGPLAFFATHLNRAYGISLAAAGGILMAFGAGGLTFAGLSPLLVRRLGERGLAAAGGGALLLALSTIAFATAWPLALAGAFVAGTGFYMLHNTLQTNATQMAPQRRGAGVALFASAFFLGQSAGVGIASLAVERVSTAPIIGAGALATLAIGLSFSRRIATHRDR
jgi:predicted MFS family arabinose efflux permease